MLAIDNKLISDEVVLEHFVCDLTKCKGGCCEDGDAGAPLTDEELDDVLESFDAAKSYMTPAGIAVVEKLGKYVYDKDFGWVTPSINDGLCAYGYKDKKGVIMCSFEQAYNNGLTKWKKPISCHLYPIKISRSKIDPDIEYLNYEPREVLCSGGCKLGDKLQVPAYVFLKEALIRKYGEEFYEGLESSAALLKQHR